MCINYKKFKFEDALFEPQGIPQGAYQANSQATSHYPTKLDPVNVTKIMWEFGFLQFFISFICLDILNAFCTNLVILVIRPPCRFALLYEKMFRCCVAQGGHFQI